MDSFCKAGVDTFYRVLALYLNAYVNNITIAGAFVSRCLSVRLREGDFLAQPVVIKHDTLIPRSVHPRQAMVRRDEIQLPIADDDQLEQRPLDADVLRDRRELPAHELCWLRILGELLPGLRRVRPMLRGTPPDKRDDSASLFLYGGLYHDHARGGAECHAPNRLSGAGPSRVRFQIQANCETYYLRFGRPSEGAG